MSELQQQREAFYGRAKAYEGALVRQAEFHAVKILLLSDLGRAGQNLLLDRTNDLRADIVVAGIPALAEPCCDALLDTIRPRLIIIADSELPATARASERLRQRLARRSVAVLYSRESGAVTISFHAGDCEISTADQQPFKLKDLPGMNLPTASLTSEPAE